MELTECRKWYQQHCSEIEEKKKTLSLSFKRQIQIDL